MKSGAAAVALAAVLSIAALPVFAQRSGDEETIARVKPSVVAIGTYDRTRTPPFRFLGTAFAIGDGSVVATNAHVLPEALDAERRERVVVLVPANAQSEGTRDRVQIRETRRVGLDEAHDLALLKIDGPPLPALVFGDSSRVREGRSVLFTGFPIGAVLGAFPVTHRGMVAAVTPIAIPQGRAAELDATTVKRLTGEAFPMFQLDGTAYPGQSGSPLYDPADGRVVGVLNMVLIKASRESLLSQPSGIAYAIPSEHVARLLASVR